MRGKRAKAIRQLSTNQWVGALVEHNLNPAEIPQRALVHAGPPGTAAHGQAINHKHTLRSLNRLMKQSYKRYISRGHE